MKMNTNSISRIFNKNFKWTLPWILIMMIAMAITGCESATSPSSTIAPAAPTIVASAPPSSCIVGIWEINDKPEFLRALVPVGAFDPAKLVFVNTYGSVAYRFDNEGILTVEAATFQGRMDLKTDAPRGILNIKMNGFAFGRYKLDGDRVQLIEMIESDMLFNAYLSGEDMMPDVMADAYLPLFVDPYNLANYQCTASTLTLNFVNHPIIKNGLSFKRLR